MINYKQFVAEVRSLICEGESLIGAAQRDTNPRFRNWRLKLEDLVRQIAKQGCKINCRSASRRYGGGNFAYNIPSREDLEQAYNQEVEDTLNELRLIVGLFDKYGEPQREKSGVGAPEPGHVPTVRELFLALRVHHGWATVVALMSVVVAVLDAAFEAGALVERHILAARKQPVQNEAPKDHLELTPFRGHFIFWEGGVHDVEAKKGVSAGVPATDGRVGPVGPQPGRAVAGV